MAKKRKKSAKRVMRKAKPKKKMKATRRRAAARKKVTREATRGARKQTATERRAMALAAPTGMLPQADTPAREMKPQGARHGSVRDELPDLDIDDDLAEQVPEELKDEIDEESLDDEDQEEYLDKPDDLAGEEDE